MKNIFITGATGFLGWNVVKNLLKEGDSKLYLLVRSKRGKKQSTEKRIVMLIKKSYHKDKRNEIFNRIEIIKGEVTEKDLGIRKSHLNRLYRRIDTIYHCAALCEFGVLWNKIRKINILGTKNVLDFALRCKREGQFKAFNHISTVAVAGKSGGRFYEDSLDIGQKFNNTYEQSKFEAEKLIRQYKKKGLSIAIFRPGIITGDSDTGDVSNFQMVYQFLQILSLELFNELPVRRKIQYGFVPVNYVARAIYLISSDMSNNKTYHLVNPDTISFNKFLNMAVRYFGFKKPNLVSDQIHNYNKLKGFQRKIMDTYSPYLIHKKIVFDTTNFDSAIEGEKFRWPKIDKKFLIKIFRYCDKIGYIQRKK